MGLPICAQHFSYVVGFLAVTSRSSTICYTL